MKFITLTESSHRQRRVNFHHVTFYLNHYGGGGSRIVLVDGSAVDVRETAEEIDALLNGQQGPNTELALNEDPP